MRGCGSVWVCGLAWILGWPVAAWSQQPIQVENALLNIVETINIPAGSDGILEQLAVKEGSVVQAGDLIAEIDHRRVELDLKEAQAQLEISQRRAENDVDIRYVQKSFEVSKAELDRALYANSVVQGSVSASEIDRLQLVVEKNRLEIEQARHNFEIARLTQQTDTLKVQQQQLALTQHSIQAPISGMVVALNFRAGEWVRVSDAVARIVRMDRLRVEDFVPAEIGIDGLENRPVTFHTSLPQLKDIAFHGRVVFVHPEVNPVKSQMRIWAEIENTGLRLRPGLQGTLTILPPESN